jgi:hypothetical protein
VDDLLYFEERLYIPEGLVRLCVLKACHDFPAARHFGFYKMLELISRDFWKPQMWKAIKEFLFSSLVTYVPNQRILTISLMGFYNHCPLSNNLGLPYLWISSQACHSQVLLTPYWWLLTD